MGSGAVKGQEGDGGWVDEERVRWRWWGGEIRGGGDERKRVSGRRIG